MRASFGATFGDLLRDRQLQTLFRVGTDLDDFAAQVRLHDAPRPVELGRDRRLAPARFYGARRALERGPEATTRETTSLRYDHQWGGLAMRYHFNAVRRLDARLGVRRTGFAWQTSTRVTDTTGHLVDQTFAESPAHAALYQAEAQLAFVYDTAVSGPSVPCSVNAFAWKSNRRSAVCRLPTCGWTRAATGCRSVR